MKSKNLIFRYFQEYLKCEIWIHYFRHFEIWKFEIWNLEKRNFRFLEFEKNQFVLTNSYKNCTHFSMSEFENSKLLISKFSKKDFENFHEKPILKKTKKSGRGRTARPDFLVFFKIVFCFVGVTVACMVCCDCLPSSWL